MRSSLVIVLLVAGTMTVQAQPTAPVSGPEQAFITATREYAALHRRIEQELGPIEINADPATIRRAVEAMANAMRAERWDAKQGDFFTPALASELRQRVNSALIEHGFTSDDIRFAEWLDGIDPSTAALAVNGAFAWKFGSAMFPCVIAALPPLPPELQYRVVGNTLVLIDIHASLIVDLLPNALIETTVTDLDCGIFHGPPKNPQL